MGAAYDAVTKLLATFAVADTYTVTCDGTTTTIDVSSQACAMLTESSCTSATTCPP